jgi:hypothetical protein
MNENTVKSRQQVVQFFDWYQNEKPTYRVACDRIQLTTVGHKSMMQALTFRSECRALDIPLDCGSRYEWTLENDTEAVKNLTLALHDAYAAHSQV